MSGKLPQILLNLPVSPSKLHVEERSKLLDIDLYLQSGNFKHLTQLFKRINCYRVSPIFPLSTQMIDLRTHNRAYIVIIQSLLGIVQTGLKCEAVKGYVCCLNRGLMSLCLPVITPTNDYRHASCLFGLLNVSIGEARHTGPLAWQLHIHNRMVCENAHYSNGKTQSYIDI